MRHPTPVRPRLGTPMVQRSADEEDEWWAAVAEERGFATLREFDQFCGNLPAEAPEEVFDHEPD